MRTLESKVEMEFVLFLSVERRKRVYNRIIKREQWNGRVCVTC